jgi:hypothetical protein
MAHGIIKAEQAEQVSEPSKDAYESYFWCDTVENTESSDDYDLTPPWLPKHKKRDCVNYACQRMMT